MRAGRLSDEVTFYSPPTAKDSYGQRSGTWTDEGTEWAEWLPLRGREFFAAAQTQQETSVKVRIRRRDDIASTWRLVHEGLNYDITSVIRVGKDMTELLVMQGVKDGR